MKELELKHLAGYLPYGLKGISKEENLGLEIVKGFSIYGKNDTICLATNVDDIDLELFKPILRPLSDLTKEIEVNKEKFVPIEKILNHCYGEDEDSNNIKEAFESHRYIITEKSSACWFDIDFRNIDYLQYNVIQKLFEWHFDIYGLIEKGLAISYNDL